MENQNQPAEASKTSTGLDQGVSVLLAYLFGWIGGLIFFLIEKENRFVRFHAMQSILLSVTFIVLWIALTIFGLIPVIGWLISVLLIPVMFLGNVALVIVLIVKAYQGQWFKLPVLGDYADKFSKSTPV